MHYRNSDMTRSSRALTIVGGLNRRDRRVSSGSPGLLTEDEQDRLTIEFAAAIGRLRPTSADMSRAGFAPIAWSPR